MSIPADAEKTKASVTDSSVLSLNFKQAKPKTIESTELKFQISNTLHSSLDLRTTIGHCFDYASKLLHCDGLSYKNTDKDISMSFGLEASHKANYRVSTKTERVGELSFLRQQRFAETELAFIEMLIGLLFHPLKNALQYYDAIESSMMDALTGLKNRLALSMSAEREIKLAKRHQKAMALVLIDLDHFKKINDTHGHLAGDYILESTAKSIIEAVRDTDHVFRYGGEEFVVLLNEADIDNALKSAERIRSHIENMAVILDDKPYRVTASVGVSSVNVMDTFQTLFERADIALYESKSNGRNQVSCCKSDRDNQIQRIA